MPKLFSNFLRKRPEARVCCFHFGRCGSTLLGNMLGCHPHMDWAGELFHSYHERTDRHNELDPYQILRAKIQRSQYRCFGFETKFQHLDSNGLNTDLPTFIENLASLGFNKYVLLKRQNYLRQALSVLKGQVSGTWHVSNTNKIPDFHQVALDVDNVGLGGSNRTLLNCFRFLDETYANAIGVFENVSADYVEIQYENHLESEPVVGFERAIEFFGIRPATPKISTSKLESHTVKEIVSNYDAVLNNLKGTEYEWMCYG